MIELVNLSWIIALVAIVIIYYVPSSLKATTAIAYVIGISIITNLLAIGALTGDVVNIVFYGGNLFGDVVVKIDKLSAWFILIINFTCITAALYGSEYLKNTNHSAKRLNLHWILFIIFQLSMNWVCMIQHGLVFLIIWEIMSLSSVMLVIFDHNNPKIIKAGVNYLVQMHISIVFLTIGFIWLYFKTGSFCFDAFSTYFNTNSNVGLFLVLFLGFGLKAGFIPLHSGLIEGIKLSNSNEMILFSISIAGLSVIGGLAILTFTKTLGLFSWELLERNYQLNHMKFL